MIYVILAVIGVIAGAFIYGRSSGAKASQKRATKIAVAVEAEISRIDAKAEVQRKKDVAAADANARDQLDQVAGKKPFSQKDAAALLADAGVQVIRGHRSHEQ